MDQVADNMREGTGDGRPEHSKEFRRKQWLKKRAKRLHLRDLSWKAWRRAKLASPKGTPVILYRNGRRFRARATGRIEMPAVFCLDENRDETLQFLGTMREQILARARNATRGARRPSRAPVIDGYFDFSSIQRLGVSAALVMAALFDRQKYITGWKYHTVNEHDWNEQVLAVTRAIGFHELLEMRPTTGLTLELGRFRILRFVSGNSADGEAVGEVQEALSRPLPEDESQELFEAEPYAGIMEAVLNSSTWAYPDGFEWEDPNLEKWWITGVADLQRRSVSISVFDQGVTIPYSLPGWEYWGDLRTRIHRFLQRVGWEGEPSDPRNDALAIALAAKVGRTSTQLRQHGKGLNTMLEVAKRARHGRLRIVSRNGEYVWETGRSSTIRYLPSPLHGTLIEWKLDL